MIAQTITGLDPRSGRALALVVEDGVITRIDEVCADSDLLLAPGLIDLQVNGYRGCDVNAAGIEPETIRELVRAMLESGVTCFAPTIITASEGRICDALKAIAEARRRWASVAACIPYVHVEGPHISPVDGYRGAHPADHVRPPCIAEFARWQDASGGLVGMVTLSPHYGNAVEYIAALAAAGVHVALGHTDASAEEVAGAVEAGARFSTHLGNGVAAELARHRNPLWPQLAEDRLMASFIADGQHLPVDVLKTMLRAKGQHRAVLVSDAVALAGMPAGVYETPVGGRVEMQANGRLCVAGSELLAGATASLAQGVAHVVRALGLPLHEALTLATANPGGLVGGRGRVEVGARADLVRFRWEKEIVIEDVWLGGERVYMRAAEGGAR